jgi:hypothetical protein
MKALLVVFVLVLTGCVSHSQYGTYLDAPAGHRDIMAIDATNQLASIYPPASTTLALEIEPADAFGRTFVDRLRILGFSVQETPASVDDQSVRIGYILDSLDKKTYRLLITTGASSMSRAYLINGKKLVPSGLWTRKEN